MEILKQLTNDGPFYLVAILAVLGALGVVLEKNIIRAGFSLVICFSAVSGTYFTLSAPFVGASQILIYDIDRLTLTQEQSRFYFDFKEMPLPKPKPVKSSLPVTPPVKASEKAQEVKQ